MNRPNPLLIALAALMLSSPVFSQEAAPTPAKSEAVRAQGPVDNDNPVVRPRPAPASSPTASTAAPSGPTATPAVVQRTKPSPSASPTKAAEDSKPKQDKDRDEAKDEKPSANEPSSSPSVAPAASAESSTAAAPAIGKPEPAAPSLTPAFSFDRQLVPGLDNRLLAGLLALVALLLAGLIPLGLKQRLADEDPAEEGAEQLSPEAVAETALVIPQGGEAEDGFAETAPDDVPPAVMPAGEVAEVSAPVELALDPVRLSATLIAATFNYRLEVTNVADFPLENLAIGGGMISAHASLPVDRQLATDGQTLALLHQVPLIAPGETVELTGDLRLPLNEITPVRSGDALLFIPIARFRVEVMKGDATSAWVIGETPPVAAAALLPFRIDLGPRIWTRISKRLLGPVTAT